MNTDSPTSRKEREREKKNQTRNPIHGENSVTVRTFQPSSFDQPSRLHSETGQLTKSIYFWCINLGGLGRHCACVHLTPPKLCPRLYLLAFILLLCFSPSRFFIS